MKNITKRSYFEVMEDIQKIILAVSETFRILLTARNDAEISVWLYSNAEAGHGGSE
jgi:hypothetical protein